MEYCLYPVLGRPVEYRQLYGRTVNFSVKDSESKKCGEQVLGRVHAGGSVAQGGAAVGFTHQIRVKGHAWLVLKILTH
jgi:hypothetical protein